MLRPAPRARRALLIALAVGVVVVAVVWPFSSSSQHVDCSPSIHSQPVHATDLQRRTIYHSPQTPGYTAWVGAWTGPRGALNTSFVQATGSTDPAKRGLAPQRVLNDYGITATDPNRDFWGLDLKAVYLRSTDGGRTWRRREASRFRSITSTGYTGQPTIALKDGTILRRVNGDDLRSDPSIPHTAFLQRQAPGQDTWSAPQVLLDPGRFTYQITRLRLLRDGRLIATGNVWNVPDDTLPNVREQFPSRFLLMVSSDGGRRWHSGMPTNAAVKSLAGNEWDTAELPNGDLLAVMRTVNSAGKPVRKQALLGKHGSAWVMGCVRDAPFPPTGHPELLTAPGGAVVHIATSGISETTDAGQSWRRVRFSPADRYASDYYPRSVLTRGGRVDVFAHVGGDDPYGTRDEAIRLDTFRLVPGR